MSITRIKSLCILGNLDTLSDFYSDKSQQKISKIQWNRKDAIDDSSIYITQYRIFVFLALYNNYPLILHIRVSIVFYFEFKWNMQCCHEEIHKGNLHNNSYSNSCHVRSLV